MNFNSLRSIILLSLSVTAHAAVGPVADIVISNVDIHPDGFIRPAVVAGGTFPGPLIVGNMGDNFQLNVIDELTNEDMKTATSIHWHGFFQHGSNWADGAAFVTQCPITSGNSFLYDFNVPDQAGTFWYHSHLSTQYCDGLRGAFVVYDPNDPHKHLYDVDDESTVITLADWYHLLAIYEPHGQPTMANSTLINGLGRYPGQPEVSELAVITVERGKRYRMRLVNIGCDPDYNFSIDNHHDLTVIEADGTTTQSLTVSSIHIFAGQRYSFILNANQPVGNYWIRAQPNVGQDLSFDGGLNSAILRYVGAPNEEPTTIVGNDNTPLNEADLRPYTFTPVPGQPRAGGADLVKNLKLSYDDSHFAIDDVSFIPPTVPVLLQILSGAQTAQDLLPSESIISLPSNSVIELSLPGGVVGGGHPLHLHGQSFWVVRSAGSSTYNYNDTIIRDVVNIGELGDNVTIRFETNNPGPWFLHCHIDWHLEDGLAVVMAEGVSDTAAQNPVPAAWSDLCPLYDASINGYQY
uniref:laccase n=1 Tax=Antrodiella faginea TaxID=92699 RepID=A0A3G3M2I2_9APHY|nr:laccase D [Antrodiella faginea]